MKKFLLKIMTVVLTVAMLTGTMASCGLFEVDTDRDLERPVATVDIDVDGAVIAPENIYKREIVAGFMSYGYMYVQSYGYTLSDTYSLILDNLINNKIIIQYAKKDLVNEFKSYSDVTVTDKVIADIKAVSPTALAVLASEADVEAYVSACGKNLPEFGSKAYLEGLANHVEATYKGKAVTANDALFRFLDAESVLKVYADAIDGANSIVESFMEEEDTHEHEDITLTVRTTPTMEEEEEEFTLDQINFIEVGGDKEKERVNALAEARDRFQELGLITKNENYKLGLDSNEDRHATDNSILNLGYFKLSINGSLEGEIISAYEDALREAHSLTVADADQLWASYKELALAQEQEFAGNLSGMETALGAVSETSFVAYSPEGGYGYVSHLLIKYDEKLKAQLDDAIEDAKDDNGVISTEAKNAIIDDFAKKVVARDLRATWVQSGYGVYEDGTVKFTDKYVYTKVLDTYKGSIERVETHEEEGVDGKTYLKFDYYGVKPDDILFDDFKSIVDSVICDEDSVEYGVAGQVEYSEELNERFEDLKFAFSSDEGNFNSYLGYLYSPVTSKTQYVSAFADAAKEVCAMGAGAYKMFGSYEYGLHIVLCTKKVSDIVYDVEGDADFEDFKKDLETEGTVAYQFLEATNALIESNVISKLANTYVQEGLGKEGVVVKHEKVYKDLIEESEE